MGKKDVIEAARADVVRPAVAADDPHAAAHERLHDGQQRGHVAIAARTQAFELLGQRVDARPLRPEVTLLDLRRGEDLVDEVTTDATGEVAREAPREVDVLIVREAEAQAELGVVLEERVRPSGAAPLAAVRSSFARVMGRCSGVSATSRDAC